MSRSTQRKKYVMCYKKLSEDHIKAAIQDYLRPFYSDQDVEVMEFKCLRGEYGVEFRIERND